MGASNTHSLAGAGAQVSLERAGHCDISDNEMAVDLDASSYAELLAVALNASPCASLSTFGRRLAQPEALATLLRRLPKAMLPLRRAGLRDVLLLLAPSAHNCARLMALPGWQAWLAPLLAHIPRRADARTAEANDVVIYAVSLYALLLARGGEAGGASAHTAASFVAQLRRQCGWRAPAVGVVRAVLMALIRRLTAYAERWRTDFDAHAGAWQGLFALAEAVDDFIFYEPLQAETEAEGKVEAAAAKAAELAAAAASAASAHYHRQRRGAHDNPILQQQLLPLCEESVVSPSSIPASAGLSSVVKRTRSTAGLHRHPLTGAPEDVALARSLVALFEASGLPGQAGVEGDAAAAAAAAPDATAAAAQSLTAHGERLARAAREALAFLESAGTTDSDVSLASFLRVRQGAKQTSFLARALALSGGRRARLIPPSVKMALVTSPKPLSAPPTNDAPVAYAAVAAAVRHAVALAPSLSGDDVEAPAPVAAAAEAAAEEEAVMEAACTAVEESATAAARACGGCRQQLRDSSGAPLASAGAIVLAAGDVWHASCFVCAACGVALANEMYHMGAAGQPLCAADAIAALPPRAHCASSRCGGSAISAREDAIEALGATWHSECFVCASCGCALAAGETFVVIGSSGEPHHEACAERCYPSPMCATCGERVSSSGGVSFSGRTWHGACFCCDACNAPLDPSSSFLTVGRPPAPACAACASAGAGSCAGCHRPLVGDVIEVLGCMYHDRAVSGAACLVCAACNAPLKPEGVFERCGVPVCRWHATGELETLASAALEARGVAQQAWRDQRRCLGT